MEKLKRLQGLKGVKGLNGSGLMIAVYNLLVRDKFKFLWTSQENTKWHADREMYRKADTDEK